MSKTSSGSLATGLTYGNKSNKGRDYNQGRRGAVVPEPLAEEIRDRDIVDGTGSKTSSSDDSASNHQKYSEELIDGLEKFKTLLQYAGFTTATASTGFDGDSQSSDNAFYATFAIASTYMVADLAQKYCVSSNLGNKMKDYDIFEGWKTSALSAATTLAGSVSAVLARDKGQEVAAGIGVASAISTFFYDVASRSLGAAIDRKSLEELRRESVQEAVIDAGLNKRNSVSEYSDGQVFSLLEILQEKDQLIEELQIKVVKMQKSIDESKFVKGKYVFGEHSARVMKGTSNITKSKGGRGYESE